MSAFRGTLGALLVAGLTGVAVAGEGQGAADAATLQSIARSRVILLVEVDHREEKSYSGMAGSTFWFRVQEILRFEAEDGIRADPLWQHEFRTLSALSRNLTQNRLLEYSLLYAQGDQPEARADAALVKRFEVGRTFVLAAPTTAWFSITGTVVAGKWGSLRPKTGEPLFVPADAETVAAVRGGLDGDDRAPPYKAPPRPRLPSGPRAPERDEKGGRRG
ncbi:MAG: hypothetical protein KDD82_15580 [Planctomycetes bacterium]|nr:hypothetical protein [Planctomycetota bacterium]